MSAVLRLVDLTVSYDRHPAVHHVSAEIPAAEMTAIVGPNGAGKSTLLKALLGLAPHIEGHIECSAKRIAYLPQQAEIDRSFPITVIDCVQLGYWQAKGNWGGIDAAMRQRAVQALAAVGLDGFAGRPVSSLSVGQFQRVLFARILLQDAEVILLDEPFNAIDARTTGDLLRIISAWHAERRTVIAVLHDHDQVRRAFPQTLLLARNVVAWGETAEVMCEENLQRARAMAEAVDEHAGVCEVSEAEVLALSRVHDHAHEHSHGHPHAHHAASPGGQA